MHNIWWYQPHFPTLKTALRYAPGPSAQVAVGAAWGRFALEITWVKWASLWYDHIHQSYHLVGILEHFFFHTLGIIIPTDKYFSEGGKPPTSHSYQVKWISWIKKMMIKKIIMTGTMIMNLTITALIMNITITNFHDHDHNQLKWGLSTQFYSLNCKFYYLSSITWGFPNDKPSPKSSSLWVL